MLLLEVTVLRVEDFTGHIVAERAYIGKPSCRWLQAFFLSCDGAFDLGRQLAVSISGAIYRVYCSDFVEYAMVSRSLCFPVVFRVFCRRV